MYKLNIDIALVFIIFTVCTCRSVSYDLQIIQFIKFCKIQEEENIYLYMGRTGPTTIMYRR